MRKTDRVYRQKLLFSLLENATETGLLRTAHGDKEPFQCYVMQWGVSAFLEKKHYKGVWFNAISMTRGWVGVKFPGKSVT